MLTSITTVNTVASIITNPIITSPPPKSGFIGSIPDLAWYKLITTDICNNNILILNSKTGTYDASLNNGDQIVTLPSGFINYTYGGLYIPITGSTLAKVIAKPITVTSNSLSVSFWMLRKSDSYNLSPMVYLYTTSGTHYINIKYWASNGFQVAHYGNAYVETYYNNTDSSNKWTHFVVTMKTNDSQPIIYANKQLKTVTSMGGGSTTYLSFNDTYLVEIGTSNTSVETGYLQDVRIFNRVLTQSEVNGLY
jgi:hypothetical protein